MLKFQHPVCAVMYSVQGSEGHNTVKFQMFDFISSKSSTHFGLLTIITPIFPIGDGIGAKIERPPSTIFDSRNLYSGVSTSNK